MAKDAKPAQEPFEEVYGRLQAKVDLLEKGGLSLDDAIAMYEEGMILARECQERLDSAEQKITKLKESFAPVVANGSEGADTVDDYEYVADEDLPEDVDDTP